MANDFDHGPVTTGPGGAVRLAVDYQKFTEKWRVPGKAVQLFFDKVLGRTPDEGERNEPWKWLDSERYAKDVTYVGGDRGWEVTVYYREPEPAEPKKSPHAELADVKRKLTVAEERITNLEAALQEARVVDRLCEIETWISNDDKLAALVTERLIALESECETLVKAMDARVDAERKLANQFHDLHKTQWASDGAREINYKGLDDADKALAARVASLEVRLRSVEDEMPLLARKNATGQTSVTIPEATADKLAKYLDEWETRNQIAKASVAMNKEILEEIKAMQREYGASE